MSEYRPRRDDDEVAFLVGGQWFKVESNVQYLEGECRFITFTDGSAMEIHVMPEHVQAVLWNMDQ